MAPDVNILFITADQWRGDCLGAASHPVVRTPALDRLAAGGVSFRRHFAQAAPCGPSRAALYTGMYSMNNRSVLNGTPLDARHDNVALVARRLGYEPALFGYTDTSVDPRTVAADDPRLSQYEGVLPGFDPVCHLPESQPLAWLEWMRADGVAVPEEWRGFVDQPAGGSGWTTQYDAEHSQTKFLTDRLIEWADGCRSGDADGGWFAHVSFLRPHPPFLAPAPYDTMYDPATVPAPVRAATRAEEGAQHPLLGVMIDHPFLKSPDDDQEQRELQATYYGMLAEVDDQIARILDWLDATGQTERTLIIFTSDHGENLGSHYMLHKLGWFDESYNVPLIIRGPGVSNSGRVVSAFTEHVDVLPTICELLGTDVPLQCDGRALTPWLGESDAVSDWRTEAHWEFDFRDPDSPLLEEVFGLTLEECALAVLRDDHGKYVQFSGFPALPSIFFDIDADPAQIRNVAGDPAYAAKVLEYAQRMLAWRMQHTERTLTGMKLTMHAGLVERNATRR